MKNEIYLVNTRWPRRCLCHSSFRVCGGHCVPLVGQQGPPEGGDDGEDAEAEEDLQHQHPVLPQRQRVEEADQDGGGRHEARRLHQRHGDEDQGREKQPGAENTLDIK